MRNEVIKALEYEADLARRVAAQRLPSEPSSAVLVPPVGDSSALMSPEVHHNIEIVSHNLEQLVACLKNSAEISNAYVDSYATVTVRWDTDKNHEVVIELTLYGPLAAPFLYGPAPPRVLQHVNACIDSLGLVRLSEEEIKELEQNGNYLHLFE